jgi:uncharacterized protein YjbJ (UPF0337 family)
MNRDDIEGGFREAAGKVKTSAGRMADNKRSQTEGLYDQAADTAQEAYGRVKDAVGEGAHKVADSLASGIDQARQVVGSVNAGQVAQNTYDQARDMAAQGADVVAKQVKSSPLSSVLALGGLAFLLGWLMRGRN